jgi:hypothetical protein
MQAGHVLAQGTAANTAPTLLVMTPTDDPGERENVLSMYRGRFI